MIKIDLLPDNFRKKENKVLKNIPAAAIIYSVTVVLVSIHLLFFVLIVYKKVQLGSLNQNWKKMQPQFLEVDALKNNLSISREKSKVMQYVSGRNVYFTEFFNKINQAVPKGLWLNRLSFSYEGLVIEGSVFSFGKEEVTLVNKFFESLRNDQFFLENFANFNLDSVKRRVIKEYEVLDFLLTANTKKERFEIEYGN